MGNVVLETSGEEITKQLDNFSELTSDISTLSNLFSIAGRFKKTVSDLAINQNNRVENKVIASLKTLLEEITKTDFKQAMDSMAQIAHKDSDSSVNAREEKNKFFHIGSKLQKQISNFNDRNEAMAIEIVTKKSLKSGEKKITFFLRKIKYRCATILKSTGEITRKDSKKRRRSLKCWKITGK